MDSKIYRIVCNTTGKQYIGSTTKEKLSMRLSQHVYDYKKYLKNKFHYISSYEIIEGANYEIVLIESYPCNSKDELHSRERFHIETNECVNKVIPSSNRVETRRRYYNSNKDKVAEYNRQYCIDNKERKIEYRRQYYQANKERIAERDRQ